MLSSRGLFYFLTLNSQPFANIILTLIQPTCSNDNSKYLRSRYCKSTVCVDNFSATAPYHSVLGERSIPVRKSIEADSRCGPNYGNSTCDPQGPYGTCCSVYGFCGSTTAHCLIENGCVSGCTDSSFSPSEVIDDPCGAENRRGTQENCTQGSCCSSFTLSSVMSGSSSIKTIVSTYTLAPGKLAPSSSLPVNGTTIVNPLSSVNVTADRSCGTSYNGTVCGQWSQETCCSMLGFCVNTTAPCSEGCQSGSCIKPTTFQVNGPRLAPSNPNSGHFDIIGESGVPAMHCGLLPNGRVLFLDKVENYTQVNLPNGQYAYSSEYDPLTNAVKPLAYKTNAFCAGGIQLADGRLLSVGGNGPLDWIDPTVGDGLTGIRYLTRSPTNASFTGTDWSEPGNKLSSPRWYPSAQIMADGTIFVASGSLNGDDPTNKTNNNPTYEILDRNGVSSGVSVPMSILVANQPYSMYPFIHLLNDGNLFIFVSKQSQVFNVASNKVLTTFSDLPGDYRTYPNTGGSVLLPLSSSNDYAPDILICGGGPYQDLTAPTDASCGRIKPYSANPSWELDAMPEGRCMVEGNLLPDGTVLWLNGVNQGAQGFGLATNPTFETLIYNPNAPIGNRWHTDAISTVGRLYHSVSVMLLDGTILVAGSNPVDQPVLQATASVPWPTEFRVERYTPPYLTGNKTKSRPTNVTISSNNMAPGGSNFNITFNLSSSAAQSLKVVLYYTGFVTHSLHMGHRMVYCDYTGYATNVSRQIITVTPPPSHNVTPPGYYILFVVADGVPAIGQMVMVN